jgi:hypothetical protein
MRFCHRRNDFSRLCSGNLCLLTASGIVTTCLFLTTTSAIILLVPIPNQQLSFLFLAEFGKLVGSMVAELDTSLALLYCSTNTSTS